MCRISTNYSLSFAQTVYRVLYIIPDTTSAEWRSRLISNNSRPPTCNTQKSPGVNTHLCHGPISWLSPLVQWFEYVLSAFSCCKKICVFTTRISRCRVHKRGQIMPRNICLETLRMPISSLAPAQRTGRILDSDVIWSSPKRRGGGEG